MATKFISFEDATKKEEFVSFEEATTSTFKPFVSYEEAAGIKPFVSFEKAKKTPKTYEVDAGRYPLLVPTSMEAKKYKEKGVFPDLFTKGMWGREAEELEQLPKTEYTPIDVTDRDYGGSFVKTLLFDVLQRGEFAVANVVDRALKGETDFVQAALNGFTGKEKRDFVDVAMGLGLEGADALGVGMVAGVVLDPINYLPFYKMYKASAKIIGKTKALEIVQKTSLADFFNKAFTSGEGAPKELHRVIRFLRKEKRWAESNVFEEVEKLSKLMKTTENAELLTKVRALKISPSELTVKQSKVLKYIDNQLDRLAREGVRLKMLRPEDIKANYIPGYYDGLTKVAMDIKSGHRGSPFFAKAQNVDNIVDYNNARNTLIEGVQKAVKGKNLPEAQELLQSFPLASGKMLVDDASGYTARQLLLKAKSVPKPTMNLIESYGYRKLAHIAELYRQKVINTVLDPNLPYAKPISRMTNKTVRPGNAYFVAKYRLPDINLKEADDISQALYKRVTKMAVNDLIEIEPKMAEGLLNSPYMQKLYKGRGMRVFEMPQEIADYMNKTSELFTVGNKQAEQVLKAAAHLQNLWKPLATIARPFWHVRNISYNQMQLFLSGVSPWDLIPKALQAQKIQRGKKGLLHTAKFGDIKLSFLKRNSKRLGLYGVGFAGGDITTEPLLSSKMGKALKGGKFTYEKIHVKTLVQRPAEFMEDNAHLVAWLDYLSKSKDADLGTAMLKGAEHAFKYVFDYGDISVFERSYMKLLDPFYCVSEDTECLTDDGWKKHNEIEKDNKLLTYNLKTKELEWQKHKGIFTFDYDGELISFDSKNINLLCTPNHRCITEEAGIREAIDVSEYGNHCPMVGENTKKDFDIPDRILSLLGWVITDGHTRRDYGDINIYQKKYNDIIKELLGTDYGFNIHPDTGVTQFRITGELRKELKKWFKYGLWRIVIQLSKRQCNIMKEAIMLADGGYAHKGTKRECAFIAQQKGHRDLLQLIWFLAGYNCKLGKRGFYERKMKFAKYLHKKAVLYKGIVWCPSTENTTAIFRRNGVITISGQTWHRKAVGLYAGELLQHPDKFSKLGKAKRTLGKIAPETEQEKALKPDWMKEQGYIKSPFKIDGKPLYVDIAMPPDDLQMLFSLKDVYGVLTPYKTIFELIHKVTGFPELGTLEEGETPAPAWMVSLPEKTWKLLKLRPGRQIDYSTGTVDNVLMIPKAYLRAIETALPTMRDVHNMFPQPVKLSLEKATTKTWSQGTGVGIITENITGWRNAIYHEINELQKEIAKEAKKYEGVSFKGKKYNYTESKEYLEKMQRIRELGDKLRY